MGSKDPKSTISRRSFLNLGLLAGAGFVHSQFAKLLQNNNESRIITAEDLHIIRNLPIPEEQILVRIIDDTHVITEEEVAEFIEPRLVYLRDLNELVEPYGFPLVNEETQAHELCVQDLGELLNDCFKENLSPYIASAFRDHYAQQVALLNANENEVLVTQPGHSQHHSGLAFDFTAARINKVVGWLSGFENTPEGIWFYKNAYRYGFIQSYTQFHDDRLNESWHYIYVGRPIARYYIRLKVNGWDGDIFDLFELYKQIYA